MSSFDARHITGPNGEKLWEVNGKVYATEEEGGATMNEAVEDLWAHVQGFGEEDDRDLCMHCGWEGCVNASEQAVAVYHDAEALRNAGDKNRNIHKHCYHAFSHLLEGYLGKGNRKELPKCVTMSVHDDFLVMEENDAYTSFQPTPATKE